MKNQSNFPWVSVASMMCLATSGVGIDGTNAAPRNAGQMLLAANFSASGTHQCRTTDGEVHSCVVTGLVFGNCIDAQSSLRSQDCCPSTRVCARDARGRETQCRRGGTSAGFTMNYCISGP